MILGRAHETVITELDFLSDNMGIEVSRHLHEVILDGDYVTEIKRFTFNFETKYYPVERSMYNSVDCGDGGVLFLLRNAKRADMLKILTVHRPERHQDYLPILMEKAAECAKLEELVLRKCGDFQMALYAAYCLVAEKPRSLKKLHIDFTRCLGYEEKQNFRTLASVWGWRVEVRAMTVEFNRADGEDDPVDASKKVSIHRPERHRDCWSKLMEKVTDLEAAEGLALLECSDFQMVLFAAYCLARKKSPNLRSLHVTFVRDLSDEEKQKFRTQASVWGWRETVHAAAAEFAIPV